MMVEYFFPLWYGSQHYNINYNIRGFRVVMQSKDSAGSYYGHALNPINFKFRKFVYYALLNNIYLPAWGFQKFTPISKGVCKVKQWFKPADCKNKSFVATYSNLLRKAEYGYCNLCQSSWVKS